MKILETRYDSSRQICVRMTILEAEALLKILKPMQDRMSARQEAAYQNIAGEYLWAVTGRKDIAVKPDLRFAESLSD